MPLSVGQKILGIALTVLVLMGTAALYSTHLIGAVSNDLQSVSVKQIPFAQSVSRADVSILELRALVDRAAVLDSAVTAGEREERFDRLALSVRQALDAARAALTRPAAGRHGAGMAPALGQGLDDVASAYAAYETAARAVFAAAGRNETRARLAAVGPHADALNERISRLRREANALTASAIRNAARDERRLLLINAGLTALAALLGLGFAIVVTRTLVRGVRGLVDGASRVEEGDLDVAIEPASRDELGRLAGSFNAMVGGLRMKERIKDTFGTYIDPRIVEDLLDRPEVSDPGGERREMTVMFIDLKGFTSISEALPPDDLVRFMNRYFEHMTDAIAHNGGVIDKFIGDAVMAYWGPPFTGADDHARLACRAAVEALGHLERFRADAVRSLPGPGPTLDIDLRIGVSTGEMIVGTVGSRAAKNFTIMGDAVNLGSRLEGANKVYGSHVMISDRTRTLAGDSIMVRELDLIRVKGKHDPTRVYELLAEPLDPAAAAHFDAGLAAYRAQDWDAAEVAFAEALEQMPGDGPSALYRERIGHFRDTPPPADWDGVWTFTTK